MAWCVGNAKISCSRPLNGLSLLLQGRGIPVLSAVYPSGIHAPPGLALFITEPVRETSRVDCGLPLNVVDL